MAQLREAASRRWLVPVLMALAACHPEEGPVSEAAQAVTASQQAKLLADDAFTNDWLGTSVAVDGDAAIAGALHHALDTGQGAAYVYRRTGTAWAQEAILGPPATSPNCAFGISVAISGDTAIVGAYADGTNGFNAGAAFVFVRANGSWAQQAKLTPMDAAPADAFGISVAIQGDQAIVGAPWKSGSRGAAYVFVRAGATWVQQGKLVAPAGQLGDELGGAVAISGDVAIAGANRASPVAPQSGAAYVFARSGANWSLDGSLSAADGAATDLFGYTVSVRGTTALVGAINNAQKGPSAGAAYVFERAGGTWSQQSKLVAAAGKASDNFGRSVALGKDTALIGAPFVNSRGAAYVFTRAGAAWTEALTIAPADGGQDDRLAEQVGLSGSTAILGTIWNDSACVDCGAAYVFALSGVTGAPCTSAAECASGHCASGVCCDAACSGACETCSKAGGATEDGACTQVEGVTCDDGDGCTMGDVCTAGTCAGTPITCMPPDACHEAGTCSGGLPCAYAAKPDGTLCPGGTCMAGACTPTMTGTGGGGTGGSGGAGGATTTTTTNAGGGDGLPIEEPKPPSGCGCRTAESEGRSATAIVAALAMLGLGARRRRRS